MDGVLSLIIAAFVVFVGFYGFIVFLQRKNDRRVDVALPVVSVPQEPEKRPWVSVLEKPEELMTELEKSYLKQYRHGLDMAEKVKTLISLIGSSCLYCGIGILEKRSRLGCAVCNRDFQLYADDFREARLEVSYMDAVRTANWAPYPFYRHLDPSEDEAEADRLRISAAETFARLCEEYWQKTGTMNPYAALKAAKYSRCKCCCCR